MIKITIDIAPMGAVRMTRRGKFVKSAAQRYLKYKDLIGFKARQTLREPLSGPLAVKMVFVYPIPKSWSLKKRAEALRGERLPEVKPDLDNAVKGVFDALNGIAWVDDKQVVREHSLKRFGEAGQIIITVEREAAHERT